MGTCTSSHTVTTTVPINVQSNNNSKRTTPIINKSTTNNSSSPTNIIHPDPSLPTTAGVPSSHCTTGTYKPSPANILLNNRYELLPGLLGKGHFAKVKQCIDITTGIEYACKIIDKKELLKSSSIVKQEVDILKQVGPHPHTVALIDTYENSRHYYLIMELCVGGDLFSKIIEIGKFSERHASNVCQQLATALQYIHSKNVVHRDLKPENILLTESSSQYEYHIKIADFGLAKLMKNQLNTMKTICGTWAYW